MRKVFLLLFSPCSLNLILLLFSFIVSAQVGIGTTNPTETLDVVGNVKFSGALMPDNQPGTANEILLSGGVNSPSIWGPEFLNITQTNSIGRTSHNLIIPIGANEFVISDNNCSISSTCFISWSKVDIDGSPGTPAPNLELLNVVIKAEAGQWRLYIDNQTSNDLDTTFSYLAFY